MHVMELLVRELASKAVTFSSYCIPKKNMSLSTLIVSEFPRVIYLYWVLKQTLPVALSVHCQTKVVDLGLVLYTAVNEKELLGEKTRLQPWISATYMGGEEGCTITFLNVVIEASPSYSAIT